MGWQLPAAQHGFHGVSRTDVLTEQAPEQIRVEWTYTLYSHSVLAYPFHWFFTKVFWRGQMKKAIRNMQTYAASDAPFLYE